MKKTRVLALSLIVMVMLMGAGYAYWSDTLIINNTVATGEMNVVFDRDFSFIHNFFPLHMAGDTAGEDYVNDEIVQSEDNKTLTVTAANMYPGSMMLFAAKALNKGSIPALFDNAEVDFSSTINPALKDNELLRANLIVAGGFIQFNKNNEPTGENGWFFGTLGELKTKLDTMFAGLRMEPGDYIVFDIPNEYKNDVQREIPAYNPDSQNCIIFYLPEGVGNDMEKQTAIFDIRLNFKQHNQ